MVGERGATSMSNALKSNTTLTQLNIGGKHKRNNTQKEIHQQATLFPFTSNQ